MPSLKRQRPLEEDRDEVESESESSQASDSLDEEGNETDASEELIDAAKRAQTTKGKKRKRALSPEAFGAQLASLISQPLPSSKSISAAHRPLHATSASIANERKSARQKLETKHQRLERGHIKDVIGGWNPRPARPFHEWSKMTEEDIERSEKIGGGQEGENELRRLAQRGVVKLFNAIRAAQGTSADDVKQVEKVMRKTITDGSTPATEPDSDKGKQVRLPNALGSKGKEQALANLSKESFLQILKSQA